MTNCTMLKLRIFYTISNEKASHRVGKRYCNLHDIYLTKNLEYIKSCYSEIRKTNNPIEKCAKHLNGHCPECIQNANRHSKNILHLISHLISTD